MTDQKNQVTRDTQFGIRLGWFSILANALLFALKYVAGIASGSVALIADAWHTLSDSLSSVILIVGLRISRKPPDEEHPFGHGRAEWISSLMIGVFLIVIGVSFIQESLERLRDKEAFHYGLLAWMAVISSIVIKEIMAQMCFAGARKTGLQSLKADGWHHRTDSLSSVLVLAGLLLGKHFWWIDGVLGIVVSLLIFVAAFEILKENISNMIGRKPNDATIREIHRVIHEHCEMEVNLHAIRIHFYGYHKEMTAHIKLPPDMKLEQAHEITNRIEELIEQEMDILATIHTEPL